MAFRPNSPAISRVPLQRPQMCGFFAGRADRERVDSDLSLHGAPPAAYGLSSCLGVAGVFKRPRSEPHEIPEQDAGRDRRDRHRRVVAQALPRTRRPGKHPAKTIRRRTSRWWCRSRPAAATMRWGGSWPTGSAPPSARRWWSRTAAPAPASSGPARRSRPRRRLHADARHTGPIGINPTLYVNAGFDPRRTSRRSASSRSCRWCCWCIPRCRRRTSRA